MMKKLLLLLVPVLLLFGVGFADVFNYSYQCTSPACSVNKKWAASNFWIQWSSWNIINLQSFQLWTWGTNPDRWALYRYPNILLTSWYFNGQTWTPNYDLVPWQYSIFIESGGNYFNGCVCYPQSELFTGGWFWQYISQNATNNNPLSSIFQGINMYYYYSNFVFSWADPRISTSSTTIYYNWTSTWGFANVYLIGNYLQSLSGWVDLLFNIWPIPAVFTLP